VALFDRLRDRTAPDPRTASAGGEAAVASQSYLDTLAERLDLLLEGRASEVPEGDDPLTRRVRTLADRQSGRAVASLTRMVDISVAANRAVFEVAGAVPQARAVDDRAQSISSAVEELSTSVSSITEHSREARQDADQVAQTAESGVSAAERAAQTMDGLVASVEQASGQVSNLSEASRQIGEIVQQIQDIAEKTNLLALNATIEAARAGEAGKGFAVVADEVKSLANQTQKATETIRGRIENLQGEISNIVSAMEDSSRQVREGQEVVSATSREMKQVAASVDSVKDRLHHVAAILEEQTGASNEIASSVATIAEMSKRNVDVIEAGIERMEASEQEIVSGIEDTLTRAPANATIQAAKSDHMIWMRKLAQMLAGRARLHENELADHHACRLGRWYDAQTDEQLTRHPAWKALRAPHERVHACGIEAARRYNAGELDAAADKVREAGEASHEVMQQLDRLAADFT